MATKATNDGPSGRNEGAAQGYTHYEFLSEVQMRQDRERSHLLELVVENDDLLYKIMTNLVTQNRPIRPDDGAVFNPLLRVCKYWRNALTNVWAQMRYDCVRRDLESYISTEQKRSERSLLELFYVPPTALLHADTRGFGNFIFSRGQKIAPQGILFIRRALSWAEVHELKPAFSRATDPLQYREESGAWYCLAPPQPLDPSIHVLNDLEYDEHPRLVRFKHRKSYVEECIRPYEYAPFERGTPQRTTDHDVLVEHGRSLTEHRWVNFIHVRNDRCVRFVKDELLPTLGSRPTTEHVQRDGGNLAAGMTVEDTRLVFPFDATMDELYNASFGLRELGGQTLIRNSEGQIQWNAPLKPPQTQKRIKSSFTLAIRDVDISQLSQQDSDVNETIVNFFMQWISRNDDPRTSEALLLSSHFFTVMDMLGVKQASSWLKKRKIDVFTKRYILLPIFRDSRWSLCIIVNPGHIRNEYLDEEEQSTEQDFPCIFQFDGQHSRMRHRVVKCVIDLLNLEAKRLEKKFEEGLSRLVRRRIFNEDTMEVFELPESPRLGNKFDGGLFVCRYTYAFYLMRRQPLKYSALGLTVPYFPSFVRERPELSFNGNDIKRLRKEMKMLVENLSRLYSLKRC